MGRVLLDCDVRLFLGANLEVAEAAGSKINRASEQSHVQHNTDPVSIRRNLKMVCDKRVVSIAAADSSDCLKTTLQLS